MAAGLPGKAWPPRACTSTMKVWPWVSVRVLAPETALEFPNLSSGRRVYSSDEAPRIPIDEIPSRVKRALQPILERVALDERVAITAGSRGIANMPLVLKACGDAIKEAGGDPFVMPAMGSHGGATAEGQRDVLAGY